MAHERRDRIRPPAPAEQAQQPAAPQRPGPVEEAEEKPKGFMAQSRAQYKQIASNINWNKDFTGVLIEFVFNFLVVSYAKMGHEGIQSIRRARGQRTLPETTADTHDDTPAVALGRQPQRNPEAELTAANLARHESEYDDISSNASTETDEISLHPYENLSTTGGSEDIQLEQLLDSFSELSEANEASETLASEIEPALSEAQALDTSFPEKPIHEISSMTPEQATEIAAAAKEAKEPGAKPDIEPGQSSSPGPSSAPTN